MVKARHISVSGQPTSLGLRQGPCESRTRDEITSAVEVVLSGDACQACGRPSVDRVSRPLKSAL
jgi:hypothetical protein